ncbi:metal ABC transporter solute-binding protein, Zn/Mn family [Geminocystis sp. GBBB08]|uniref:metal ABC transporter solute-binding protein, Zn/Mn family n=1 Tax=Geminocystis sp. GBBB08 TaxID=2604140 RepID=UPI0027E2AA89|nr:zinc ABC transporter substrate-binding protein [Geminocystis sp. GBBB08]MBL1208646.1 cation ABC transporter substrate-binding protein [Geminocystis sp. GBBB08]
MKIFNLKLINLLLIFILFNLAGCNQENQKTKSYLDNTKIEETVSNFRENKLNLTVSILPQKYFVEKIGGELVAVNVMVEPGMSAETYEPLPQQLANLSKSSAYISIGVPFEEVWLEKIKSANAQIPIINSGKDIDKITMIGHNHQDHEDEKTERKEGIESLDPHIWLSPKLAKIQAENIYQELVKLDPKNKAIYKQNLTNFLAEIDVLDQQITEKFANVNKRKFLIYHAAWGYFAKDYNLQQIPIEFEGQEATSAELANLIKQAKSDNITVIFAQPQFSKKTVDTLAKEINAQVVLLDDLAENWAENLLQVADKLAQSMK